MSERSEPISIATSERSEETSVIGRATEEHVR